MDEFPIEFGSGAPEYLGWALGAVDGGAPGDVGDMLWSNGAKLGGSFIFCFRFQRYHAARPKAIRPPNEPITAPTIIPLLPVDEEDGEGDPVCVEAGFSE